MTIVFIERREGDLDTEAYKGERPREEGRDWSYTVPNQENPRAPR